MDSGGHGAQTLRRNLHFSFRILKTLCRKLKLPEDLDYQQLARLTPGYVGADLMALCREAAMNAVNRVLIHLGGRPRSSSQPSAPHPSTAGSQTPDGEPGPGVESGQDPPQVPADHSCGCTGAGGAGGQPNTLSTLTGITEIKENSDISGTNVLTCLSEGPEQEPLNRKDESG